MGFIYEISLVQWFLNFLAKVQFYFDLRDHRLRWVVWGRIDTLGPRGSYLGGICDIATYRVSHIALFFF